MSSRPSDLPVIGLAHGSRHPGVAPALDQLMSAVGDHCGARARAAFLDLTEPDLETVASALAAEGYERAVVVPLLFTAAFHATIDVPQTVRGAADVSGVDLIVADIIGTGDDVVELLQTSAADSGIPNDASLLLFAVGSSRDAANAAVHDLAARLESVRSAPVLAAFGTSEPRPEAVIDRLPEPRGIVPLFLSPGLLLDPLFDMAVERKLPMADPIGDRAAAVIADRYARALGSADLR
jgi:sirohydrochlorin cobaltochelatase